MEISSPGVTLPPDGCPSLRIMGKGIKVFTMKIAELHESYSSLIRIAQEKVPARLSMRLALLIGDAEKIVDTYERTRAKLAEALSKKDEEGKPVTRKVVDGETYVLEDPPTANRQLAELGDEEIGDRIKFKQITLSELGDIKIAPVDLYLLRWLIVPDQETEPAK